MKIQVIMLIPLLVVLLAQTSQVNCARVNSKVGYTMTFLSLVDSLFLNYTYLPFSNDVNPCAPVTSRSAYIALLSRYGITSDDGFADYHMEHIIDKSNTPYDGSKDIIANLVMADATWNIQVGQLNWSMVEREKRIVYRDIFDNAVKSVVECSGGTYTENDDEEMDILDIMLLFGAILIGAILLTCVVFVVYETNLNRYLNKYLLRNTTTYDDRPSNLDLQEDGV